MCEYLIFALQNDKNKANSNIAIHHLLGKRWCGGGPETHHEPDPAML